MCRFRAARDKCRGPRFFPQPASQARRLRRRSRSAAQAFQNKQKRGVDPWLTPNGLIIVQRKYKRKEALVLLGRIRFPAYIAAPLRSNLRLTLQLAQRLAQMGR